nr:hypothetical protein [Tanacetum cinerariifolium]
MEQYLAHIDYALWKVILNGNSVVQMTKDKAAWSNISLIMRNKPGIDNLDIDDLYNNLKVYKADIKGSSESFSNSHNVAFVFIESTSSTNEVNATYSVSTATGHSSQAQEQIDQDDLQEMDLKWQVAMLSIRVKRFYKKTRRKLEFNGKEQVGFDKTKVECFNCRKRGHFARDYRLAKNSWNRSKDVGNAGYRGRYNGKRHAKEEDEKALVVQDGLGTYDWSYQVEEEAINFARIAFTSNPSSSSNSNSKFNEKEVLDVKEEEVIETVFDNHSSEEENSLANDRFKKGERYHAVPHPLTGNYMPPKFDLSVTPPNWVAAEYRVRSVLLHRSITQDIY